MDKDTEGLDNLIAGLSGGAGLGTTLGSLGDFITPGMGSLLGAGVSMLGGLFGSAQSRDYQTQMSNTSYQRAVADLKAAGLNPMLAYSQGGASTPNWSMPNVGESAVHSGAAAGRAVSERQLMQAQLEKTQAETYLSQQEGEWYAEQAASEVYARNAQGDLSTQSSAAKFYENEITKRTFWEQVDMIKQKLSNMHFEGELSQTQREKLYTDMEESWSRMGLNTWSAAEKSAYIQKLFAELTKMGLERPELESIAKFFRSKYGAEVHQFVSRGAKDVGAVASSVQSLIPKPKVAIPPRRVGARTFEGSIRR